MDKKLRRSASDVKICGVCGGIAEYFGWDSNLVRLLWIALSILLGVGVGGVILYFAAAVLLPKADEGDDSVVDARPEDVRETEE